MGVHPKVCPPTERNSSAVEQHMRSNILPEGLLEMYTITEELGGKAQEVLKPPVQVLAARLGGYGFLLGVASQC